MLRELEDRLPCGLKYLLDDLDSIRLGPMVRYVFEKAPPMKKRTDGGQLRRREASRGDGPGFFFGCGFAVEEGLGKGEVDVVRSHHTTKTRNNPRTHSRSEWRKGSNSILVSLRRMLSTTDSSRCEDPRYGRFPRERRRRRRRRGRPRTTVTICRSPSTSPRRPS
mmetsp:Transcript_3763/g.12269  ORF Transcript_3763/g.12269 Transcript_3763/m.12269 type:complete len:165 (+) Transcript_3763:714-1208(+)